METVSYEKKRYFILLALSVITTLILPLLRNLYSIIAFLNNSTDLNGTVSNVIFYIGFISAYAGYAVLIFAAIRYRFKFCLPFVAVAILENIVALTVAFVSNKANGVETSSTVYSIINILLSWALPFAYIGIAKTSAKYLKKEFIVILITFLGMLIVSLFVSISSNILYLLLILNPGGYTSNPAFRILDVMKSTLVRSLRGYLYITAAYLIIRLIFTDKKREKFFKILSTTKTTAKKLWELTSK